MDETPSPSPVSFRHALPAPLAVAYAKAEVAQQAESQARALRDLMELTVRYLALCAAARVLGKPSEAPPAELLRDLSPLRRTGISMGSWLRAFRTLDRMLRRRGDATHHDLDAYRDGMPASLELMKLRAGGYGKQRVKVGDVLERFVELRNQDAHVGTSLLTHLATLRMALDEVFHALAPLRQWELVDVSAVNVERDGQRLAGTVLKGEGMGLPLTGTLGVGEQVYRGLFLRRREGDQAVEWVELSPFIIRHESRQLLSFAGLDEGRPTYELLGTGGQSSLKPEPGVTERLQERAGFLFARDLGGSVDQLQPLVMVAAADGVITQDEQAVLRQHLASVQSDLSDDEIARVVAEAIEKYGSTAKVEAVTPPASPQPPVVDPGVSTGGRGGAPKSPEPPPVKVVAVGPSLEDLRESVLGVVSASSALPTRHDIVDATGLETADVNRALNSLRREGSLMKLGRGAKAVWGEPPRCLLAVLQQGPITTARLRGTLGLDHRALRDLLRPLQEDGTVVRDGAGRGVTYRLASSGLDEVAVETPVDGDRLEVTPEGEVLDVEQEPVAAAVDGSGDDGEEGTDWTEPAIAFLSRVQAAVEEHGLAVPILDSTDISTLDEEPVLTLTWRVSARHLLRVQLREPYEDMVPLSIGFTSTRRSIDPAFRRICGALGAASDGDEVELDGQVFLYCPADELALQQDIELLWQSLGKAGLDRAVARRLRSLGEAVAPHLGPGNADHSARRPADGEEDGDSAEDDDQQDALVPSAPPDWQTAAVEFLRKVDEVVGTGRLGITPRWKTDDEDLTAFEGGWTRLSWGFGDLQAVYVAVGGKYGTGVGLAVGLSSEAKRRDPLFRRLCRELGAGRRSEKVSLGERRYTFQPARELNLESKERVQLADLASAEQLEATLRDLRDLMAATNAALARTLEASDELAAPESLRRPPAGGDAAEEGGSTVDDDESAEGRVDDMTLLRRSPLEVLQRAMLQRLPSEAFPTDVTRAPRERHVGRMEGKWSTLRWWVGERHHYYVAVGRRAGDRLRVAWGFGTEAVRRDPEYRALLRPLGVDKPGDRLDLNGASYTFTPRGELDLRAERPVELGGDDQAFPDAIADEVTRSVLALAGRVSGG